MTILADTVDIVIGVDPHKHTHTAAVVAAHTGKHHASRTSSTTTRTLQMVLTALVALVLTWLYESQRVLVGAIVAGTAFGLAVAGGWIARARSQC
ncbi:MAG TPA: hypothetical protein DCR14_06480 [Acidimicrobiaceae bacterium]|nr:hypothetical protein [Acidimicrobiaceae bacterium]